MFGIIYPNRRIRIYIAAVVQTRLKRSKSIREKATSGEVEIGGEMQEVKAMLLGIRPCERRRDIRFLLAYS